MPEIKLLCYFKDNTLNVVEGSPTLVTGTLNVGEGSKVYTLKHAGNLFASLIVKSDDISYRLFDNGYGIDYQTAIENILPSLTKQIK